MKVDQIKVTEKVKARILQYGAKYDQSVAISIVRSKINSMRQFKDSLRNIVKFSDLNNDVFYSENGQEVDENYIQTALRDNEIIFVTPQGRKFCSTVKLNKYEYISDLKQSKLILVFLAKNITTSTICFIKKIEITSVGNK